MTQSPCGLANKMSSCMVNGNCSKNFLKHFNERTILDEDGYSKYKKKRYWSND